MRVEIATQPGHTDRVNEDFVGATTGLAVLLDGAGIPNTETICQHGVAWYASTLGGTSLSCWARRDTVDLKTVLAMAIREVAGRHRRTCDIADPSSPQASVAMVAVEEQTVRYLVLADTYVVLGRTGDDPMVITDGREVQVRRQALARLHGLTPGTSLHGRMRAVVFEELRGRRNQSGGYWIAKDDPAVAAEALTGSIPLPDIDCFALLSNGSSRVVDPYDLLDWPGVVRRLHEAGSPALLRTLRQHEKATTAEGSADDASVIFATLRQRSGA